MIKLSEHSKGLIKFQEKILYYIGREEKFKEIYDQANRLIAVAIDQGIVIDFDDLMSALFDFDGGSWETEKMFPKYKD